MSAPDYFCELLEFVMPWTGGQAALLVAYFDASERDGGTFGVAGLAFGSDRAKKATRDWRKLWGDTRCHMTDLHTRKKEPFKTWTAEQAGQRLVDSVSIINAYVSYAVAVSCDLSELNGWAPQTATPGAAAYLDGFKRAYAVCCNVAMTSLGGIAGADTDIAYFFESGDQYQNESQRFISLLMSDPLAIAACRYRSHTVMDKTDARIFEMSDILAWEWAKQIERTREGKPMRGSLKALLGEGYVTDKDFASDSRRALHLTGEPLKRYFDVIKEFILSDPLGYSRQ